MEFQKEEKTISFSETDGYETFFADITGVPERSKQDLQRSSPCIFFMLIISNEYLPKRLPWNIHIVFLPFESQSSQHQLWLYYLIHELAENGPPFAFPRPCSAVDNHAATRVHHCSQRTSHGVLIDSPISGLMRLAPVTFSASPRNFPAFPVH